MLSTETMMEICVEAERRDALDHVIDLEGNVDENFFNTDENDFFFD